MAVSCRHPGQKTHAVFERYSIVSECDLVDPAKNLNAL
jgi:hypothetical protein